MRDLTMRAYTRIYKRALAQASKGKMRDVYKMLAAYIFETPYSKVTQDMRTAAKRSAYLFTYGLSGTKFYKAITGGKFHKFPH